LDQEFYQEWEMTSYLGGDFYGINNYLRHRLMQNPDIDLRNEIIFMIYFSHIGLPLLNGNITGINGKEAQWLSILPK